MLHMCLTRLLVKLGWFMELLRALSVCIQMRSHRRSDLAFAQVEMLMIQVQGLKADEEETPERDLGAEKYKMRF